MKQRGFFRELWNFLWNSDSAWSWIIDLILAFIIVKWIFFPLLSLIFASSLPMVVVESTSMVHETNFDGFWSEYGKFYEEIGIFKSGFEKFSFKNGFNKGDIMAIHGQQDYRVGDIIVFRVSQQSTPIIHRIIKVENETYSTKGDHNPDQLNYEKSIQKSQVIGKAVGRIPMLGWLKLIFVEIFRIF